MVSLYDDMPEDYIPSQFFPALPARVTIRQRKIDIMFGINGNGEIFVTKNFSDPTPVWRRYKRIGWAIRFAKGIK